MLASQRNSRMLLVESTISSRDYSHRDYRTGMIYDFLHERNLPPDSLCYAAQRQAEEIPWQPTIHMWQNLKMNKVCFNCFSSQSVSEIILCWLKQAGQFWRPCWENIGL